MDGAVSGSSIAKRLASCNKSSRDRAVRLLTAWFSQHPSAASTASDGDLLKIWKGLFYCIWHADKLPAQLHLINRLASILPALDAPLAARYLDAFLVTVRREWAGIDFLRLDKFYLLIRRFLRHFFLLLGKNSWDPDLSARMIGILSEKCLLSIDNYHAQGVNYHLAEIFLDEIAEFLPIAPGTLDVLLNPFHSVIERSPDKVLVNKIKVNVFDRLLENGTKLLDFEMAGAHVELGGEVEKFGKIALAMGLSKKFFDSASASETIQGNRKVLFGLHHGFLKLEKDLENSGVHVTVEQLDNGIQEKELVSESAKQIEMNSGDLGSEDKPPKKRKKSKKSSDDIKKKSKTKKKKLLGSAAESNVAVPNGEINNAASVSNGETVDGDAADAHNLITFDEPIISNLQKQFEKVAAEAGMALPVITSTPKKRKRAKSVDRHFSVIPGSVNGESMAGKSGEKSTKKVRFSMKNNLVWKPHNPLPPQSLRVPPSATPRGSALKKGIPPGPIKETPPTVKKIKVKTSSVKKGRKGKKSISPAIKRLRQLQSFSV